MQDKHSNNSPYVVNSTYAKFKRHSLKKLKIKTNGNIHILSKNINSHVHTNTNTSLLNQNNTHSLPPIITSNSLSNINYRSKTPSNIKTNSLNEDVIPTNVNIFNKKEVQLIVSLKNELKNKNEENQKLLNTIKTIRSNQYSSNKALEQKNLILNNEIKRVYGLLEQMNYQNNNNNNVNTFNNNNDVGSPLCSNPVGNSNDSVINELREQIDLLQKNLDKQILQNKKLKEANVSLNSNRANMQKANYDLQNQIQKLQDIIDNKDKIINEQVNIINKQGINNNNNKSNSINESDLFESNSSISYDKQYRNRNNSNKNHIRKIYHINTFAFSIEGVVRPIKEDAVNSMLPKTIPHVHSNSNNNTHTKNKNISFSFIHNKFPYNKHFTNITPIPLLHTFQYIPNKITKQSLQIISNHISFNIINTSSLPTNNEQPYYQNIISQHESNTIIYLLLKTIQSKNLLPAMLYDEILQLTPFTIEHISTYLINTLHMNNDSLYILNRLICGMCFNKENIFSYETFKQQLKLTFNDNNYLTNTSLDKEMHISNEIEQNALNEIITLCIKCDCNQFGFISYDMFNCICKAYVNNGHVTQKGFEYLIYLMKKGNHNENIMMLYYKGLNELIVNKKDVVWKERFVEDVERKSSLKKHTFKNVNEILRKEESKMYMEHAKVFVDDVFEKVLEERGKCYDDDMLSVNKEGVVIENMFNDEEGE